MLKILRGLENSYWISKFSSKNVQFLLRNMMKTDDSIWIIIINLVEQKCFENYFIKKVRESNNNVIMVE